MVPHVRHSTMRSVVMRNPDRAKKLSRRKKPPAVR